jgi:hypothetical protein
MCSVHLNSEGSQCRHGTGAQFLQAESYAAYWGCVSFSSLFRPTFSGLRVMRTFLLTSTLFFLFFCLVFAKETNPRL